MSDNDLNSFTFSDYQMPVKSIWREEADYERGKRPKQKTMLVKVETSHYIKTKDRIEIVSGGYWSLNSKPYIDEKEWYPISDEGYVVRIKRIKQDAQKAIVVIRIQKRPGILFSIVPDDIGTALKLEECIGTVYSECASCKTKVQINEYLETQYGKGVCIEKSELFETVDQFEYKTKEFVYRTIDLDHRRSNTEV